MEFCILDNYLTIALLISLNAILIASTQPKLKLVNVVFRHGDRTFSKNLLESFPTDPYLNYSFLPTGAQLTNNGKKREYELGQALRDRYKKFLGDLYLPKLVVGHSSDYDRTKMSLQLVLAALFPPTDRRQRWNPNLNWQPIPTTYVSPKIDDNFFLGFQCPKYLDEYDRVLNLPEVKKQMSQFKDVMSKLTKLSGKNIEKPLDLYYLYHTFVAQSTIMNLPLPEWAYDYFPELLFNATILEYNFQSYTSLLKRLSIGPMIRTIFNNMKTAKKPIPLNTKLYLYSGHESNIAVMLHAFQLYKPYVPAYSSAIILELLKQNRQYYVKILYYRGIPPIFDELQIPGCEMLCPFGKFSYLIHDLIPSDEDICDKRQIPDYINAEDPVTLESKTYNLIKKHQFNEETKSQLSITLINILNYVSTSIKYIMFARP